MRRTYQLGVLVVAVLIASPARAEEKAPAPTRYFYVGEDYGSQAMYGPLWVLAIMNW